MKHIILITAYNQLDNLLEQLSLYDQDEDFAVYIHWDKNVINQDIIDKISEHPSVKNISSLYCINWGGRNLLCAMRFLCQCALRDLEIGQEKDSFFHLISGSDVMIRTIREVKYFFERHKYEGFMEYFPLPTPKWYKGGLDRLMWRHPLDRLNIHNEWQAQIYQRYLQLQEYRGHKRRLPSIQLYGGSCWWSLPRYLATYWVAHFNDENLFERLEDTYCPEEIHPQTILLNSPYKNYIRNNPLRYICWDYGTRGTPAVLEPFDLSFINHSEDIWARKISKENKTLQRYFQWFRDLADYQCSVEERVDLVELATYLLKHAKMCPLFGLMDGRMGAIVYLCCYAHTFSVPVILRDACKMIDDILDISTKLSDTDFHNGVFGIMYALAWLFEHKLIPANIKLLETLNKFDEKVLKSYENEKFETYFQFPFWQEYHQLYLYTKVRKLPCPEMLTTTNISPIKALLGEAGKGFYKSSIGMSGLAGYGFSKIQNLFPNIIPQFIV